MSTSLSLSNGSQWRRWDPHLHAPGTLLSDQFDDDWDGYLSKLETAEPRVEVLGITDYYSLDTYKQVLEHKRNGRLADIGLIFPNIEMRLTIDTEKKKAINVHYLFCPDDPNHIEKIERALQDFSFKVDEDNYRCTRADLIRLGRLRLGSQADERAALKEGANQFKVTFDQIKDVYGSNSWMKSNCLIAVSGTSHDGTAGLQGDDSFASLREEIERSSHVILSSNETTRRFWLGQKDGFDRNFIETKFGSLKPCVHGSDAHRVEKCLEPDLNRYCWIKGDATFEALRQIVLEPHDRVHLGELPPHRLDTGDHITRVVIENTPWLPHNDIRLNPGLVAIIGARGSGKTALADIIARAANADHAQTNKKSFLYRAAPHLANATVTMGWDQSPPSTAGLWTDIESTPLSSDLAGEPGVRYLSQQFVERLCSSNGLHSELIDEIERVIFNETDATDRLDCDSFQQLASLHLDRIRSTRSGLQETIADLSSQIVTEDNQVDSLPKFKQDVVDWDNHVKKTDEQMKGLLPKGDAGRAANLSELEGLFTALTTTVDKEKRRLERYKDLRSETENVRKTQAPQYHEKLKGRFSDLGLSENDWNDFRINYVGDVELVMAANEAKIQQQIDRLSKFDPAATDELAAKKPKDWPLEYLVKRKKELEVQVGIDAKNKQKYASLQSQLEKQNRSLQRAKEVLERASGAPERRKLLTQNRRDLYRDCVQTYIDETSRLEGLYAPLHRSFSRGRGAIARLRFSVTRNVDLNSWINAGKELFDLRMESSLRGHDALHDVAKRELYPAWLNSDAETVSTTMAKFIQENYKAMQALKPPSIKAAAEISKWKQRVATWLYDTDHISLSYSMTYDNVPIERLSPGTRGIVLLLLYLVIDKNDKRPLIIDQPEENLDPRSVYEELVDHFREVRKRRQVIIVTHNANLVVNADADQIIVATPTPNEAGGLPTIDYESGSLEDPRIRKAVCQILEGGERAFLDRERRYRLQGKTSQLIS